MLLETRPAGALRPAAKAPLASWKGGSLSPPRPRDLLKPFVAVLDRDLGPAPNDERTQVEYEILGEAVRAALLLRQAEAAGFAPGAGGGDLPAVVAKDFYWPQDLREPSPQEAAVGRFLRARVLGAGEERAAFDRWLGELWRTVGLDFRGELLDR